MDIKNQNLYTDLFFDRPSEVISSLNDLIKFDRYNSDAVELYGDKSILCYSVPLEENRHLLSRIIIDVQQYLELSEEETGHPLEIRGVKCLDLTKLVYDLSNHFGVRVMVDNDEDNVIYCSETDFAALFEITYQSEIRQRDEEQYENQFSDIMIDIETLDTKPTAVILSIGAVAFNLKENTKTEKFYAEIDADAQIRAGRTASMETIKWWVQQRKEVRATAFRGASDLALALDELAQFIRKYVQYDGRIWAKSPAFDLSIIKNALGYENIPWHHINERCVRTYIDDRIVGVFTPVEIPATHHPLEDCKKQISEVCEVWENHDKNNSLHENESD